jgi:RNA polymerase sigma-70 factor (ECF subfamily)
MCAVEQPLPKNSLPLSDNDALTLSRLRRGQFAAMEDLVLRYQDRLYSTVYRIVSNPEDAADIVQETFVKAMENLAKFEGKSSLYTWLFRIAVNQAISHRRKAIYRQTVTLDGGDDDDGVNQQAANLRRQLAQETENDPAVEAASRMDHQRVLDALRRLDDEFRIVLVLRDVEGCDYDRIADILEVPVGTVKSRLFRARLALRTAVEGKQHVGNGATNGTQESRQARSA